MQRIEIINAIHNVLANELNIANIEAFSPTARLNEDLYLDSVLVLQILVSLELTLGIDVPDDALNAKDFETVETLCNLLLSRMAPQSSDASHVTTSVVMNSDSASTPQTQEFEDIKVHCFVSCLCEAIKADERVDHRPFYFGVWDADVVVDDNFCINYHAQALNHDFFRYWYQKLYGVEVNAWYQTQRSKSDNIMALQKLLDTKTASESIMVMLDMFRLPERENKFNQNPFPHYVMLENSPEANKLMMLDPDFRWEGLQDKQQVMHAIASDAVAGGYVFDSKQIQPSSPQAINDYFIACLKLDENPMTAAVRLIIKKHLAADNDLSPANLQQAFTQLPVLAIRKYAYEHGLAYFMLALSLDFDEFEDWCDVIEALVSSYKLIQFRAMKIANSVKEGKEEPQLISQLSNEIMQILAEQDDREFAIKQRMQSLFLQWQQHMGLSLPQATAEVCL